MKLRTSLKYQLNDYMKAAAIYYLVVLTVFTIGIILTKIFSGTNSSLGGLDGATVIFMFVLGLNSFKDSSKMMLQNGVSRLTQFKAIIISMVMLALAMLVIDSLLDLVIGLFIPYLSTSFETFQGTYPAADAFTSVFNPLLWQFGGYMVAAFTGLAITILYVRMRKGWKIAVSISVPVFFFVAVPILAEVFEIRLLRPIVKFIDIIFGVNPYIDSVLIFLIGTILTCICFLMARKARFE